MTESSSLLPATVAPAPMRARARGMWIAIALLACALVVVAWRGWTDLSRTQREFARRIAEAEARGTQAQQSAQESANAVAEARTKIAVLEARLAESQSQQASLEQLYQELSRNRDEVQLADIDQALTAAAQQLQLLGNVQAAILTLQGIDARLARLDKPQFLGVRRALQRDLERLRALPSADISGIAVKLDQLVAEVDALPMLADARLASPAPATAAPALVAPAPGAPAPLGKAVKGAKPTAAQGPAAPAATPGASAVVAPTVDDTGTFAQWWSRTLERVQAQARELVRIREVGSPDALLLAPPQAYFVRENLKLRLLNARLQLLSRNEAAFRSDVAAAQTWVQHYFDLQPRAAVLFVQTLKSLQGAPVSVELPPLTESLNAVRNFRPGGGVLAPSGRPTAGR